jgi:hypothetical protein
VCLWLDVLPGQNLEVHHGHGSLSSLEVQVLKNVVGAFMYSNPTCTTGCIKKKLNRFEIALNFAKHLFVSDFLYIELLWVLIM